MNNNTSNGMGTNTTHGHRVEVADVVAAMKEVESANVLVTNANTYVAVELKEGNKGDEHLENKIAEHVRNGNLVEEFPETVRRVFPNAH